MFADFEIQNPPNAGLDLLSRLAAIEGWLTGLGALSINAPVVTQIGAAGSTNYSYVVVATLGNSVVPSTATQTTTGAATLTAANANVISWNAVLPNNPNVVYNIYRSASSGTPSTTGLIGTVNQSVVAGVGQGGYSFTDTGIAGNSATVPSLNTSNIGQISPMADPYQIISGSTGAIALIGGIVWITYAGVSAVTLAQPKAGSVANGGNDGVTLNITDTTGHAHTVTTASNGIAASGITTGNKHILTFGGTANNTASFVAYNGLWIPKSLGGGALS